MQSQTSTAPAGFGALFDLSFTRFITISLIKVVYILAMVGMGIGWLTVVVAGFTQGFLLGVASIVVATILTLLYLLITRMALELVVVIFRIGENTAVLAGRTDGPTGGFPVSPMPVSPAPAQGL